MKCFYHTDMDGHCAGAIVKKWWDSDVRLMQDGISVSVETGEYIPINYNNSFPFDNIIKDELVLIVDFSLQKEGDFEKLLGITKNVVWIDHHKTAIERHTKMQKLDGIRRVANLDGSLISGCELTWEYFYDNMKVPPIVELLGDYDTWTFKFKTATNQLQAGIRLYNTNPESPLWDKWLDSKYYPTQEIKEGEIALAYRDNYYAGLIKSWSFLTEFEGYKAIACNAGSVSSQLFDTVKEDYDIMMPFVFDGKQWTVSLYTKKSEIDVSELAKKYGGGGHKQASGFQCHSLPFKLKT